MLATKDAVAATMIIVEIETECKSKGITLYDKINEIYEKYGYYLENLSTETVTGIYGIKNNFYHTKIKRELSSYECDRRVKTYSNGIDELPQSDVLKFVILKDCTFCIC